MEETLAVPQQEPQDQPRMPPAGEVPLDQWRTHPKHAARCSTCEPACRMRCPLGTDLVLLALC